MKCYRRRGLIIGKFYPVHNGHCYLIDTAVQHCDELVILICSQAHEEISGEIRKNWLRALYPYFYNNRKIHIIHSTVENVQAHRDNAHAPLLWAQYVLSKISAVDIVFSSENYGAAFAQALQAIHMPIDVHRVHVPISATMIRDAPCKYREFLPEIVQNYYSC